MSPKPQKKSDISKHWMQPRHDKKIQILPEYHLIVTEGKKTEPNYFAGLEREINSTGKKRIRIQIEGEGTNTLDLLKRAQYYVSADYNLISHVWLVYDRDDFPADNFDNTFHKCTSLNQNSMMSCIMRYGQISV